MMLKVSEIKNQTNAPLRLAVCGGCKSKQWLPSDVPAMCTTPCTKCGHPVMLPASVRQFELREIVASGGAGKLEHFYDAVQAGATILLAASVFHFKTITIPDLKSYLRDKGVSVTS